MSSFKIEWDSEKVLKTLDMGGARGLRAAANFLLDQSRKEVPLNIGTLSRSGFVDVDDAGLSATVGYDTPYAVRWHENDARFQHGRKKKYLEDPLNNKSNQRRMLQYMKDGMKF